jgi:hypothetical protein
LAKSLTGSLWRLISSISGFSWPNRSPEVSGKSFSSFLGSVSYIALRKPLATYFKYFSAQLAQSLSGRFWQLILSISGFSWPNRSQDVSGGSF